MVPAGELRVGNWYVFLHPVDGNFTGIGEYIQLDQSHFASAQEEGYELEKLLWPIQLSDQIISECGFVEGKLGEFQLMAFGTDAPGYVLYYSEVWLAHVLNLHHLQSLVAVIDDKELPVKF